MLAVAVLPFPPVALEPPVGFSRYSHGWFFSKDRQNAFAIGYVSQIIGVTPTAVLTHFYKEDWKKLKKDGCKFVEYLINK